MLPSEILKRIIDTCIFFIFLQDFNIIFINLFCICYLLFLFRCGFFLAFVNDCLIFFILVLVSFTKLTLVGTICLYVLIDQEAIESVEHNTDLDIELHGKLHVLYGGTKVVQHSPPSKTGPGMKGSCMYLYIQSVKDLALAISCDNILFS